VITNSVKGGFQLSPESLVLPSMKNPVQGVSETTFSDLSPDLLAEIKQIKQISEIEKISLQSKAWVLFDIDDTVTMPQCRAFQNFEQDKRYQKLWTQCAVEKRELLPSIVISSSPRVLVSQDIPGSIAQLQKDGYTALGCTATPTSSFYNVSILKWREEELKRLGVVFTQKGSSKVFDQFASHRGTFPIFQEGVLYTNMNVSKGDAIVALLDHLNESPSQILLIDDLLENILNVQETMKKRAIPFLGLHFLPIQEEGAVSDEEWYKAWGPVCKYIQGGKLSERK